MSAEDREIDAAKKALRSHALKVRDRIAPQTRLALSDSAAGNAHAISVLAGSEATFSIYATMGSEIDPIPTAEKLIALGHTLSLPVMIKLGQPLIFRRWIPGDELRPMKWGIREPLPQAPEIEPDVLLLPMLAFDQFGWRLGYGGGFYDRTLARLRARKPIIAIGLAFDEQEVDAVPHAAYDERLDLVLTPSGLRSFQQADK